LKRIVWMVLLGVTLAVPALAQEPGGPDAEGCKDSKLLTRMPGCTIAECAAKEFDAASMQIKPIDTDTLKAPKQELEGQLESLVYVCPARLSALQIQRNFETALKAAGFTIVFTGKDEDAFLTVTARKGAQWVNIRSRPYEASTAYDQTALKVEAMKQDVAADASAMAAEIASTGSVAVYGINFDTGKATLQAGSDQVLGEMVKLLQDHADWRFEVQGHTDNVGAKGANLTLSDQRAKAVVAWLTQNGIAAGRLVPKGYGDARPVGENTTDEGRAKNRRVELKKLNEE
jgi:OmpA-OmpF porin, OOP family